MMKAFLTLLMLLMLCVGCAAEQPKEPQSSPQPALSIFKFNEADFISRYEAAQNRVNSGEAPAKPAPVSTDESGFAVIPLIKETYGIEAFAVLPIMERDLTDEEMLQLAYGMNGVSSSEILSAKYSWYKPNEEDAGTRFSNRVLTFSESNNRDIAISLYYNEGKRANAELSNHPSDGGPICIDIPELQVNGGATLFWVYPISEMTQEHFLQMMPLRYEHVTAEHYTPLENQVQYSRALELADQYALDYQMNGRVPDSKFAFYNLRRNSSGTVEAPDLWTVWLIYENDYHYMLAIDANDGTFSAIARQPLEYFTRAQMPSPTDTAAERTDEEIIEAASLYAQAFANLGMEVKGIEIMGDTETRFFGAAAKVEITVHSPNSEAYVYDVEVIKESLLINRVALK